MARKDEVIQKLKALLPADAFTTDEQNRTGAAVTVQVPLEKLRDAVSACDQGGYFLEALSGLDFEDTMELVYHVNCYEPGSRIALRALCGHEEAAPTICDIFPAAKWYEREVHDYFGIAFENNPDLRPLLLPEDADFHPLKKTFGKVNAYHTREEIYG
jgi:NADH-quinone oxidoreductase subunit C